MSNQTVSEHKSKPVFSMQISKPEREDRLTGGLLAGSAKPSRLLSGSILRIIEFLNGRVGYLLYYFHRAIHLGGHRDVYHHLKGGRLYHAYCATCGASFYTRIGETNETQEQDK